MDRFCLNQSSDCVDAGDPADGPMWGYTTDPTAITHPENATVDTNRRDIGYHYTANNDYEAFWYESIDPIDDIIINFVWDYETGGVDCDTSVCFLSNCTGWACDNNNEYMSFTGDDTSAGGYEEHTIRAGAALENELWDGSVTLPLYACFYQYATQGNVIITVTSGDLEKIKIVTTTEKNYSCCPHQVGTVTIYENGYFKLQ
jgi:hypothetical protein